MQSDLCERTLALARARPATLTLQDIADNTGLTVFWLKAFVMGKPRGFDVRKVETLYRYLTGKKLELA